MEKRILLTIDGSEKGFKAVSIVGDLLKEQTGYRLVLYHCVQQLARFYPGELCEVEQSCRLPLSDQEKVGCAVLDESRRLLVAAGFPADRIDVKLKMDSTDPALDILREAEGEKIRTIALGRRGRGQLETFLLGGVTSKVAQYARYRTVWIVDTPVFQTRKVLVAFEGASDARTLTPYVAEHLAPISDLQYTFLHLMPPVPPTFWDDGHILDPSERKDRQARIEKWRSDWIGQAEGFLDEARGQIAGCGVPRERIRTHVLPTKQGIARDLLTEIAEHQYQMVVMGKRSFHERKPFLLGSHANKVMQNVQGAILCLVDAQ